MKRVQVVLRVEQRRALSALSRKTGRGVSALVREAVDALLEEKKLRPVRKLSDICGIGRDPNPMANEDIDRLIYG